MSRPWKTAWIGPRALWRCLVLLCYIPGVYVSTHLRALLPRYSSIQARIEFARRYYFLTAVLAARARVHLEHDGETRARPPGDKRAGARAHPEHGAGGSLAPRPCLYVSNHISWMDILTLYRALPVQFVSKSEVARWPLFGHFARWAGTIFLVRGRGGAKAIAQVTGALAHSNIVLFPEGTSTVGRKVRRFLHPAFRAAIDAGVAVVPVSIFYHCHGHDPSGLGVSYCGEESLLASAWRTVRLDRVDVHIKVHAPIDSASATAMELARSAHARVAAGLAELHQRYRPDSHLVPGGDV